MKKSLILIISTILVLGLCVGGYFLLRDKPQSTITDATKFKEEYESLNDTVVGTTNKKYNNVVIPEDNKIKYVTVKETIDLLDDDKAIIYVGANWCPWCRNALMPMFDVANSLNVDKIYYLNLDNDKSTYEIKDSKLVMTREGTKDYYDLLNRLNQYLRDYILTDKEGNSYDTNEKRIYMPYFITVKDGIIVEAKGVTRTLEDGQDAYSEMTDSQYKSLYKDFTDMFSKVYTVNNACSTDEACD